MLRYSSIILFIIISIFSRRLLADGGAKEVRTPETQAESQPTESVSGEIIFFPDEKTRPKEGRFQVTTGQAIPVCLKINSDDSSSIKKLKEHSIGFRIVMEDSNDPPQVLTVAVGNHLAKMKPNDQGCFQGTFTIPISTKSSTYQISDLLLAQTDQSYYSLRDYLYSFTQADELEVKNPKEDSKAPQLVQILSKGSPTGVLKVVSGFIKIELKQIFIFQDLESGIDKDSPQIFYDLLVDGQMISLQEANCRSKRPQGKFICGVRVGDAKKDWGLRKVGLKLNSVQVKDLAGNELILNDPKALADIAKDVPIEFEFFHSKPWPIKPKNDLSRDKLY